MSLRHMCFLPSQTLNCDASCATGSAIPPVPKSMPPLLLQSLNPQLDFNALFRRLKILVLINRCPSY